MTKRGLDTRLSFRVPEEVAAHWKQSAAGAGLSLSDWIRQQVGSDPDKVPATLQRRPCRSPKRKLAPELECSLAQQAARIGNNLNQIARNLNSGGKVSHTGILAVMLAVEASLRSILKQCT